MSDDNVAPEHVEGVEYIMRKQNNDLLGGIIAQQQTRIEELEAKHQETFQMYVDANEARIDAEAKLAQQDDLVQAAVLALMGYDAKGAGAKDAGEGFDLAISMALAAIREGGEQ